jgi:hypothetical protein
MPSPGLIHWSGLAGMAGGLLSMLFAYFYVMTHGSTQTPRNATLFGLSNLQYYQLSIVWQVLLLFGLIGVYVHFGKRSSRLGRRGASIALVGIALLVVSTILQVYLVDPGQHFSSLPVQGGWMLQLLSYPVYAVGMVLLAIAVPSDRPWLKGLLILNGLLPFLSLFPYSYVTTVSRGDLLWDTLFVLIFAPYGLSWLVLGYVLWAASDQKEVNLTA